MTEPLDQDWATAVLSPVAVNASSLAGRGASETQAAVPLTATAVEERRALIRRVARLLVVGAILALAVGRVGRGPLISVSDSTLVQYDVTEGALAGVRWEPEAGTPVADDAFNRELWQDWQAMASDYWARHVVVFEITDNPAYVAAVRQVESGDGRWQLLVNADVAREHRDQFDRVFVHELAHIVTLGDGRIVDGERGPLADRAAACDGAPVDGGCAAPGSVLAEFVRTFWTADDLAQSDAIARDGLEQAEYEAVYARDTSRFVSAYASSDPVEDLAETIVAVAFDRPPRAGTVAAEKAAFVATDAELFALIDRVRATLIDR